VFFFMADRQDAELEGNLTRARRNDSRWRACVVTWEPSRSGTTPNRELVPRPATAQKDSLSVADNCGSEGSQNR
jgi:hypothetical protein